MENLTTNQKELVDNLVNGFAEINKSNKVKSDNIFYELVEDVKRDNKRKEELLLLDKVYSDRFMREFYDDVVRYDTFLEEIGLRFSATLRNDKIYEIETFDGRFLAKDNTIRKASILSNNQLSFEFRIINNNETIIGERIYYANSYTIEWGTKRFKNLSEAFSDKEVKQSLKKLIDLIK